MPAVVPFVSSTMGGIGQAAGQAAPGASPGMAAMGAPAKGIWGRIGRKLDQRTQTPPPGLGQPPGGFSPTMRGGTWMTGAGRMLSQFAPQPPMPMMGAPTPGAGGPPSPPTDYRGSSE